MIEIKKTLAQAPVEQSTTKKLGNKRDLFYKIFRKTKREQHLIRWKKSLSRIEKSSKKNKKEEWEKFASSLNRNAPINQAWNRVGQLKDKDLKKSEHP